jgi:uridine phosphorylase
LPLGIVRGAVPARLRPTAPIATDAILVGDPGRALLLAQELLEQPKMSNHARGLWGYTGRTPAGQALTIQSTGMGAPSAALVLADLAKLGVKRAIRVGTCTGLTDPAKLGKLLLPTAALATGGSASSFGLEPGASVQPDPALLATLATALGSEAHQTPVASLDTLHSDSKQLPGKAAAADMQTAAIFARASQLDLATAAVLIVTEVDGNRLDDQSLENAAKRAGQAAAASLAR